MRILVLFEFSTTSIYYFEKGNENNDKKLNFFLF
jgi:hypothetical protein